MPFKLHYMLLPAVLYLAMLTEADAQSDEFLYDCYHHKRIPYERMFPTLNDDIADEGQVQIEFPQFRELPDEAVRGKLNKRLKEILFHQVSTDSFRTKLTEKMQLSLPVYFSLYYLAKDPFTEYGEGNLSSPVPQLKDVGFRFLSAFRSVVTLVAKFEYEVAMPRGEKFTDHYMEVYYFDLTTGKAYRPAHVFKPTSEAALRRLVEARVKEEFQRNYSDGEISDEAYKIDMGYHTQYESEEEETTQDTVASPQRTLVDFTMRDGFGFPRAFSFAYYIPVLMPCGRNIGKTDIQVRLTFDEIRDHLNPNGPFAGLTGFRLKKSTPLRNQYNPESENRNEPYIPRLSGEQAALFHPGNIRTLTIKRMMKNINTLGMEVEGTPAVVRKELYDKDGYLTEVWQYDEGESSVYSKEFYSYDRHHNLIKHSVVPKEKLAANTPEYVTEYAYDSNRNLIRRTLPDRVFYYADDFMVEEWEWEYLQYGYEPLNTGIVSYVNQQGLPIRTVHISQDSYSEGILRYDSNNNLLLRYGRYPFRDEPFSGTVNVYNDKGKLWTRETDRGTSFLEYRYDDSNNLVEVVERAKRGNMTFKYDADNRMVQFDTTFDPLGNGSPYHARYFISYELWK